MRIGILKGMLLGGENFSISAWQLRSALEPGGAPGPAPRIGDATGVAARSAPMHLCRGDPTGSVLPRLPEVFPPGHP